MCEPSRQRRKWKHIREGDARGETTKEQRRLEGALEEGHSAADPAAKDGEGEPKVTG